MSSYLSRVEQQEIYSRLPDLRARYQKAVVEGDPFDAALAVAWQYLRLELWDRASRWLAVCEAPDLTDQDPRRGLGLGLAEAELALGSDDGALLERATARLVGIDTLSLEEERAVLSVLVRSSLARKASDTFALFERAFRHLRHHPSPLWSSRFYAWRALWLDGQGKASDSYVAAKRALLQAQASGNQNEEIAKWLLLAERMATPKPKALRAIRTAVDLAREGGVVAAEAEAHRLLSVITRGPKEPESSLEFREFVKMHEEDLQARRAWDRSAHHEDRSLLGTPGEGRRLSDARLLAGLALALSRGVDLARTLDEVYPLLGQLMTSDIFGVALWEPGQQSLDYSLFIEDGRRTRVGMIPIDSHRSLGAWCFRHRKSVRINDIDREYRLYLKELSKLADHRPKSMLFYPLISDRGLLGIITVQAFSRGAYDGASEDHLAVVASMVALRLHSEGRPGA